MKKKGLIIGLAVVAVLVILVSSVVRSYNGLAVKRESVNNAQAVISTQLQRRADLIPNFVATVKGYSDYEQETYTAVTQARSAVSGAKTAAEQSEAAEQLDRAISVWVNAITEAYPDLKANEQYSALQYELAGTENRISQARKDYNDEVESYNAKIAVFPTNLIAGIFGFERATYFEAQAGTESVPQVSFE